MRDIRKDRLISYEEALKLKKEGKKVSRYSWNGKGMFVVMQKGYPDGIPCNKQTAEAWGMNEGDLFKCEPYFQIKTASGSHAMWVPSVGDILATDWFEVTDTILEIMKLESGETLEEIKKEKGGIAYGGEVYPDEQNDAYSDLEDVIDNTASLDEHIEEFFETKDEYQKFVYSLDSDVVK